MKPGNSNSQHGQSHESGPPCCSPTQGCKPVDFYSGLTKTCEKERKKRSNTVNYHTEIIWAINHLATSSSAPFSNCSYENENVRSTVFISIIMKPLSVTQFNSLIHYQSAGNNSKACPRVCFHVPASKWNTSSVHLTHSGTNTCNLHECSCSPTAALTHLTCLNPSWQQI